MPSGRRTDTPTPLRTSVTVVIAAPPPRARAVNPQPDRRAGAHQGHDRRDPRAQPGVGGRAVRDARTRLPQARDLALGEMHAVREPHVVAEPADVLEVLDRPHPEPLEAE